LQIRINNSFVSSFREAIYKLKCRSEVCIFFVGIINGCLSSYLCKKEFHLSSFMLFFQFDDWGTQVVSLKFSQLINQFHYGMKSEIKHRKNTRKLIYGSLCRHIYERRHSSSLDFNGDSLCIHRVY